MTRKEKHKKKLVQNYKEGTSEGTAAAEEAAVDEGSRAVVAEQVRHHRQACKSVAVGLSTHRDK